MYTHTIEHAHAHAHSNTGILTQKYLHEEIHKHILLRITRT